MVALLAMKYRRAPLPVPRSLERALACQGLVDDPTEHSDLARRYPFLGDAQILLAEPRKWPAPITNSLELAGQLDAAKQIQWETGVQYQCP
jgi:hypothetical protein